MSEKTLRPIIESYNTSEEFLYSKTYLFIKGFAIGRNMKYTLKALPLARQIHNGQYRKGTITLENGEQCQLPYVLHVLKVASTLISLSLPLNDEELDVLISASLLHDVLEDNDGFFKADGHELVSEYGFPEEVYQIVKLLSKRPGASYEELNVYFNAIKKNKYALLIKMADRSHNVEDLYNMKIEKLHKYVTETRTFIYPLSSYAKANYPELSNGVTILKSKIVSLTELTETLVDIYNDELNEKIREIDNEIQVLNAKVNSI
jgi:GTP pyrophosphokinase